MITTNRDLARRLDALEKKHNIQFRLSSMPSATSWPRRRDPGGPSGSESRKLDRRTGGPGGCEPKAPCDWPRASGEFPSRCRPAGLFLSAPPVASSRSVWCLGNLPCLYRISLSLSPRLGGPCIAGGVPDIRRFGCRFSSACGGGWARKWWVASAGWDKRRFSSEGRRSVLDGETVRIRSAGGFLLPYQDWLRFRKLFGDPGSQPQERT